jgi:hypothetical protein
MVPTAEWLEARAEIISILVRQGILSTKGDIAGFWDGDKWVSIYDLLEAEHGN